VWVQTIERILSAKSKRKMFFLFDSTTSLCHSMDYLFPQKKKTLRLPFHVDGTNPL
jgi:hypothetical protein